MRYILYIGLLLPWLIHATKYMDSHSCAECHQEIYDEFETSMHSRGYFNDALHRKIADAVSKKKYDCAVCHMPMADNLSDLISGKARPDKNNKTHTDAISCYFCHTIAYVRKAHRYNLNVQARQAKNYKPTLYGRLTNPDPNDKHSSVDNPIYASKVCTGCHSHKLNENNVTIFNAMGDSMNSQDCIKCHMPEVPGGADKINKRARMTHASHRFLGIHDPEFRARGVDINISVEHGRLTVMLTNKMGHPLIIQSARAKYMKIKIFRDVHQIWSNYTNDSREDKQGYFAASFKRNGEKIIIPATATSGEIHNLGAHKSIALRYSTPRLQSGDRVEAGLYFRLAKRDCAEAVDINDTNLTHEQLIKKIMLKIK